MPAFLMNKAFLGASVGVQNGSKTVMASAAKVVKRAAKGAANKVGGLKQTAGYRRSQGAPLAVRRKQDRGAQQAGEVLVLLLSERHAVCVPCPG